MTKTKFEVMDILNAYDIPCGPILSMKELAEDPSLRATGTVVEVDHPTRGKYLSVGNPIKLSARPSEVKRSPLLGEHTEEVLREVLGYSADEIRQASRNAGATGGAEEGGERVSRRTITNIVAPSLRGRDVVPRKQGEETHVGEN